MRVNDCCSLIRQRYAEIGNGDQGYISKAVSCAVQALNAVVENESIDKELREQAAYAAANLLISDYEDK